MFNKDSATVNIFLYEYDYNFRERRNCIQHAANFFNKFNISQ